MRYTVTWLPSAEHELADIWNRARNKAAVTAAANRIDTELADDPDTKATPFYGDWLYAEPPLAVVFTLSSSDCKVEVTQVWFKE